jgi:putative transcriptional regulator
MIRNNVANVMDDLGIGTSRLQRLTGVNRSILGRLYRNELSNVNLNVLDAICRELDVPLGVLFVYVPDECMCDADHVHMAVRNDNAERAGERWQRSKQKKSAPTAST